jgi:Na+/melibiose symporter-like transporter
MTEHKPAARRSRWINRNFGLLWAGQSVSQFGSAVTMVILPLVAILSLHTSTIEVAILAALETLPFLVFGLPAGAFVERRSKRDVMLASDLLRAVTLLSVPVALWSGSLTLAQLYVVVFVVASGTVVFEVAYQSYLPSIVDSDELIAGNAKLATSESLAGTLGPALGGALARVLGIGGAVVADVLTYIASLVSLAFIREAPAPAPATGAGEAADDLPFSSQMKQGLGFVVRHPILRRIAACGVTANLFAAMFNALLILYLIRTLDASTTQVGVVLSFGAVGGVLGGVSAERLSLHYGREAMISWPLIAVGWPALLIPLASPGWGLALVAAGVAANTAASVIFITAVASFRHAVCPPEILGRVTASLRWMSWGTLPVGALSGGLLAAVIGLRSTVAIAVTGCWLAGLWVVALPSRERLVADGTYSRAWLDDEVAVRAKG